MVVTASKLRANIYRILDEVLHSGRAVDIERRGKRLQIVATHARGRLTNLPRRPITRGNPDALVHRDWSSQWKPKWK